MFATKTELMDEARGQAEASLAGAGFTQTQVAALAEFTRYMIELIDIEATDSRIYEGDRWEDIVGY